MGGGMTCPLICAYLTSPLRTLPVPGTPVTHLHVISMLVNSGCAAWPICLAPACLGARLVGGRYYKENSLARLGSVFSMPSRGSHCAPAQLAWLLAENIPGEPLSLGSEPGALETGVDPS